MSGNIREILPFTMNKAQEEQFKEDEQRYIFVEFNYHYEPLKEIYKNKDSKGWIFRVEYLNAGESDPNMVSGNIFLNKKSDYPPKYYDYITIFLDEDFYNFFLENQYNSKYYNMDLRIIWWINKDEKRPLNVKFVRPTKYIFKRRYICIAYDHLNENRKEVRRACPNIGLFHLRGNEFLCITHQKTIKEMTNRREYNPITKNK